MKKLLVLAAIAVLLPSTSLAGWAKNKAADCKCACHKQHPQENKDSASAKASGDESVNMLNNAEQKAKPEKSEYLREQIYSW